MMGLLGVEALAAGELALLLYNQMRTMCVGMVTGVGNLIAAAIGRGEKRTGSSSLDEKTQEEVRDLVRSSLFLATGVAILAGILLIALAQFLAFLGQDANVVTHAQPILWMLAPGLLPMLWLNVLRQFAVGMRRAGSLFTVTLISIAVNALLNAVFIYGWLGLPKLGLAGIGLATTLVQLWTCLVYLRTVRRDPQLRPLLAFDCWRAKITTAKQIAIMGVPPKLRKMSIRASRSCGRGIRPSLSIPKIPLPPSSPH